MINIKKQDPVADAVKDILQQEALKGNQHKIDKNKNKRIDAHDFKILRGEKKVEEGNNPFDYKNYTSQIPKKPGETAGFDSKKVSTGTVYNRKPSDEKEKEKPKGVKPKMEEVEQIDELKKATVKSYIAKKMASLPGKNPKKDQESLMKAHHRVTGVKPTSEEVEQVDEMMSTFSNSKSAVKIKPDNSTQVDNALNKTKMDNYFAQRRAENEKNRPKPKNEEVEQVQEREMTPAETKEKERIVKGMKKSLKGFKQRYGGRAKSVMYATATKQAMKEESIEEGKRPESDTVPFVTGANTTSSPLKRVKEVAGAAMKKVSSDLKAK